MITHSIALYCSIGVGDAAANRFSCQTHNQVTLGLGCWIWGYDNNTFTKHDKGDHAVKQCIDTKVTIA